MLYILNRYEEMRGVLDNSTPFACPYYEDLHVENVETGVNNYTFKMPANHAMSQKVVVEGYVLLKDLDNRMQMFKIKDIVKESGEAFDQEVYCEHIAIPELLGNIVRPNKYGSISLDQALDLVLMGTGWVVGKVDFEGLLDLVIEDYISALEALYIVIDRFDAELEFEVFMENGEVTSRQVRVTERRGRETMKMFTYGKDLDGIKQTSNSEELVTALIGLGPGNSNGKRLTLAGTTFDRMPDGYESGVSADWIGSDAALDNYGRAGKHIFGVFVAEAAKNSNTLYELTLKELKRRERPQVTYEASIFLIERISGYAAEKVRIGDTIRVDDPTFNPRLILEARVKEMKRSYTAPENDGVVLGDYKKITISNFASIAKIQAKISQNEEKWNTSAFKVEVISSNGLMFRAGDYSTVLEARVYDGKTDVTDQLDDARFIWTRQSKDFLRDQEWNQRYAGGRKAITVTNEEVYARATFFCSIADDY